MKKHLQYIHKNDEYSTPNHIFDLYNYQYTFTLDVCASAENHKCFDYFDKNIDGLKQDWSKHRCWMNPPYSQISKWIKKAHEEHKKGAIIVGLVFAKTDTQWFHDYCYKKIEIDFIKGRLKFNGNESNAPYPSMILKWT